MIWFAVGVISFICVTAAPPDLVTDVAQEDWPVQSVCPDLPALPFKSATNPITMSFRLYIAKIMASPFSPTEDPNAPKNLCSPITHTSACQATHVFVDIRADGTKIVRTASYNEETKDVVCYEQSLTLADPKYHIFQGLTDKISIIDQNNVVTEFPTIPQSIIDLQHKQILTLKYGTNMAYAIYATCDKSAAWVAYSEDAVMNNLIDELKSEIDLTLTELGFNPSLFVDIPLFAPPTVDLDKCLLPDTMKTSELGSESESEESNVSAST